jgi:hypothetical protein
VAGVPRLQGAGAEEAAGEARGKPEASMMASSAFALEEG